jgi:hypothetical protein
VVTGLDVNAMEKPGDVVDFLEIQVQENVKRNSFKFTTIILLADKTCLIEKVIYEALNCGGNTGNDNMVHNYFLFSSSTTAS